jgi:hypothetical protein
VKYEARIHRNRAYDSYINNLSNISYFTSKIFQYKIGILSFAENNLTDVTINEGVTTIGEWAFSNNDISSITIPNSISKIDGFAFAYNNTTEITIGNSVDINENNFYRNGSNSFKTFYDNNSKEAGTYI